ncbi:MAG: alkaline phosphatase family protein [Prevotella sp.]|nr:alkaline phosphatase family protein [Prevotella sp.]
MNKYISAIVLAAISSAEVEAQTLQPAPRLVVNITIDQLRTDYIEHFAPLYSQGGFKKLLGEGRVYEAVCYPFSPVDKASAITAIATGTTPYYNNIPAERWLDRNTLRPIFCVDDPKFYASPQNIATSTISDELKVSSDGASVVFGIACLPDAAILSAGHAADAAFWIDESSGMWITSEYYSEEARQWLKLYRSKNPQTAKNKKRTNEEACNFSLDCITENSMGRDAVTDYLAVTFSAKGENKTKWQTEMKDIYVSLDKVLAQFVSTIEEKIGKDNVLFVLTSTGYTDDPQVDYAKYHIPTGTFYINRTANLLNLYLSAIYGQGMYVETCFHNQIYLNRKLIEKNHISYADVVSRSKEFLIQNAGVREVKESPYTPAISGDLLVEISPGWQLLNEDNRENFTWRASFIPFPIIFYGSGIKAEHINTPVTVDCIAPTIAKAIQIRAPNACKEAPLF